MFKKAIFGVLISLVVYRLFQICLNIGLFRHTFNYHPKHCRIIPGIEYGSEDIQPIPGSNKAFVSSGLDLNWGKGKIGEGSIFLVDLNKLKLGQDDVTKVKVKSFKGQGDLPINPHGLSVWVDEKTGAIFLYMVNHFGGKESVEKLRYEGGELVLVDTFTSATFHVLNDLHVVGEDQFYFTNFMYTGSMYEVLAGFSWSSIGFYDATSSSSSSPSSSSSSSSSPDHGRLVAKGLTSVNGIIAKGSHLFVAELGTEGFLVYKINNDHSITLQQSVRLNTAVDNLTLDPVTNDLVMATHPIAHLARDYLIDSTKPSPSLVLRQKLTYLENGEVEIGHLSILFSDDGGYFSGSSTAYVVEDGGMLVGSVKTKLMYCEV